VDLLTSVCGRREGKLPHFGAGEKGEAEVSVKPQVLIVAHRPLKKLGKPW